MKRNEYEGWANRATWNVALWLDNSEYLYKRAVKFMADYQGFTPYASFIKSMGMANERTGDNYKWLSCNVDYKEMNECMAQFKPENQTGVSV